MIIFKLLVALKKKELLNFFRK